MDRRACLTAVATAACAIAGCMGGGDDDDSGDDIPDDAEIVFQDSVGADASTDLGGGNGGIGGGEVGGGSTGGTGNGGSGGSGGSGSGSVFTQELEVGERLEIRITNQGYGTEYDIYAPSGETLIQEATDSEVTETIEAEEAGEYDVMINPDGGNAEVVILVYPAESAENSSE